ncbi:hypothetical protein Patl1_27288 [Pistacia atlantica]|uniref:Uncharacterized protein n=1 Tax=Pistacia atlantica TaxID=434234 RepID=A0ACC1BGD3_9ROSI|nr:hypothetical protein Patl1_27288 [Pistacia atlantica]
MTKATGSTMSGPGMPENNSFKNYKKKKSILPKIFGSKKNGRGSSEEDISKLSDDEGGPDIEKKVASTRKAFIEAAPVTRKSFLERQTSVSIEGLNLSTFEPPMAPAIEIQKLRIFVATWNVGGTTPTQGLNLEDFLQVEGCSDIYVCGFQEIVPLSAGNVLVVEDNEPAAKWLALIYHALNKPCNDSIYSSSDTSPGSRLQKSNNNNNSKEVKSPSSLNFFQKPNLKLLSRNLRADSALLKACNCPLESRAREWRRIRKISDRTMCKLDTDCLKPHSRGSIEELLSVVELPDDSSHCSSPSEMSYCLVASKQMVGIFLSIWVRKDLVPHIGHLSHLASGEKEGDELKRNADVAEILKSTQFHKICKSPNPIAPERIIDHDRVIWLGDLNYRVSLSYEETRLNKEREAGRTFSGFSEGRIFFAPTYKYSHNSDNYAGETVKSKKKRRTPAWCDRILWRGNGIEQLSYIRGESRFSDHRPVCAVFSVEVEKDVVNKISINRLRKGFSCANQKFEYEDCIPQRHSFYDY